MIKLRQSKFISNRKEQLEIIMKRLFIYGFKIIKDNTSLKMKSIHDDNKENFLQTNGYSGLYHYRNKGFINVCEMMFYNNYIDFLRYFENNENLQKENAIAYPIADNNFYKQYYVDNNCDENPCWFIENGSCCKNDQKCEFLYKDNYNSYCRLLNVEYPEYQNINRKQQIQGIIKYLEEHDYKIFPNKNKIICVNNSKNPYYYFNDNILFDCNYNDIERFLYNDKQLEFENEWAYPLDNSYFDCMFLKYGFCYDFKNNKPCDYSHNEGIFRNGDYCCKNFAFTGKTYCGLVNPYAAQIINNKKMQNITIFDDSVNNIKNKSEHSEKDLYLPFINNISDKYYGFLINAVKSKKRDDISGYWLHPDIIAIDIISKHYNFDLEYNENNKQIKRNALNIMQNCFELVGGAQKIRILSFEIKLDLTLQNFRKCYFQAVSNSTWANEGYLVAENIDSQLQNEIEILSELYGIGVILFDSCKNKKRIIYPAKKREINWELAINLAKINPDFAGILKCLSDFQQKQDLDIIKEYYKSCLEKLRI